MFSLQFIYLLLLFLITTVLLVTWTLFVYLVMGNRGCMLSFANLWCVCMIIVVDTFIALLGITWSLSCGIWLCMHMLCFGFYCFFFLTSPYIFYACVILKLFLESTFSFLLVSPVQSSLRINEWNYLLCFFLLASLMFFALFCLLFSFLLMLRGKKRFSKERHSTRPSAWEWYGKSSRTQLHPLKIVSTPTQFTLLRKP